MFRGVDIAVRALSLAGALFVVFVLGAWVAWRGFFPFPDLLRPAFIGIEALLEERRLPPTPAADQEEQVGQLPGGVLRLDRELAAEGLTLAVTGQSAHLLELDGTVRHSWHLDYERVRGPGALLDRPAREGEVYWRPARALPDGDLLAVVDLQHSSPEGLALVRLDSSSRLRWVYHGHVHHDFDVAPDGRIYVLAMGVRAEPPPGLPKLEGPMIDERLLVLSPDGVLLRDVPLLEAFAASPYAELVTRASEGRRYRKGDYLHSNNADYLDAARAAAFPFGEEGQVLLSLRELDALAVIDVERGRIVWARRDEWVRQHDPDVLESGNLLVFDNQGDYARGGRTRVVEYEPRTGAIVWQYPGADGVDLWSRIRGDQQRLPNGNTLIDDFGTNRLVEVTRDGQLAWEYRCALALPWQGKEGCTVLYAERYAPGTLRFALNEGKVPPP